MQHPGVLSVQWAAGVIEGEGSFGLKRGRTPVVSVQMTDLDVLEMLQSVLGVGKIYRTGKQKAHHKACWVWTTTSAQDSVLAITQVRPYLMSRRGARADEVMAAYENGMVSDRRRRMERDGKIRLLRENGMPVQEIADRMGISRQTASGILNPRRDRVHTST